MKSWRTGTWSKATEPRVGTGNSDGGFWYFSHHFYMEGGICGIGVIPLGFGRVSQAVLIKMKFRALTIGGRRPAK